MRSFGPWPLPWCCCWHGCRRAQPSIPLPPRGLPCGSGAALTVTLNLPFRQIANADLKLRKNGTGTIALETLGETQFSYLVLWPHLRPGHVKVTKPALRCIPDAAKVAGILAEAAEARISQPVIERKTAPQGDLVAAE